jgi:hypothetical protein
MRSALMEYSACEKSGVWPSYPEEVQELDIPRWAYRESFKNAA